jgi:hypothetical protein
MEQKKAGRILVDRASQCRVIVMSDPVDGCFLFATLDSVRHDQEDNPDGLTIFLRDKDNGRRTVMKMVAAALDVASKDELLHVSMSGTGALCCFCNTEVAANMGSTAKHLCFTHVSNWPDGVPFTVCSYPGNF